MDKCTDCVDSWPCYFCATGRFLTEYEAKTQIDYKNGINNPNYDSEKGLWMTSSYIEHHKLRDNK